MRYTPIPVHLRRELECKMYEQKQYNVGKIIVEITLENEVLFKTYIGYVHCVEYNIVNTARKMLNNDLKHPSCFKISKDVWIPFANIKKIKIVKDVGEHTHTYQNQKTGKGTFLNPYIDNWVKI